ncbi:hypothetical protein KIPB_006041 [Kipferlia bialata]|uniref:Uncharacterized protein n=1 Tax=Kipferlia bialata TaxID=797122 RepID=A0A9K3CXY6_9EUKA|nr:hypothetical protein KIPB_006041 [Kipferlia bialata]|eukprot:g6041.t1
MANVLCGSAKIQVRRGTEPGTMNFEVGRSYELIGTAKNEQGQMFLLCTFNVPLDTEGHVFDMALYYKTLDMSANPLFKDIFNTM